MTEREAIRRAAERVHAERVRMRAEAEKHERGAVVARRLEAELAAEWDVLRERQGEIRLGD